MSSLAEFFQPTSHHIEEKPRNLPVKFKNVAWVSTPEFALGNKKHSPARLAGLRYEQRLEKKLSLIARELGFAFAAHRWIGYNSTFAQLDFILMSPSGGVILIEAKTTWTNTLNQRNLYTKLLEELGLSPITSCTICQNLTMETPQDKIIHDFNDIVQDSVWQLRI